MNPAAEVAAHQQTIHVESLVDRGILTPNEAIYVLESLPANDAELSLLKRQVVVDNLRALSDEWIHEKQP